MSVLAIEVGSSEVIARVLGQGEEAGARGSHDLVQHSPQMEWVEHSPDEIWKATLSASRAALDASTGDAIQGVTVTCQRDTVVLWDRETLGSPRPAIAGADRRAVDVCARLEAAGHEERVRELTGLALDPCLVGSKLTWLAEHEPNTWALVEDGRYAVGTIDSYLVARLTRGTWHVIDIASAARTLLFDVARGQWSDELCALFGVPRPALPDVVPSGKRLGVSDPRSFLGLELPITASG